MTKSTKQLTEELSERESVVSMNVDPYEEVVIIVGQKEKTFTGPAIIIINQD
ncbi:BC1881 family protein [Planococcus rifietoensis]|uniref:BC1881 family protein n=1 Tax=Planococcus rifietoensis TaxID=200991 RepID=UPI000AA4795A|nr:BC1881 family protein [Planococcus rifietoensis]